MTKKKKRDVIEWLDNEGLMDMSAGAGPLTAGNVHDLYKTLSDVEQEELLRMLLSEGGLQRVASVVQNINTPGAVDMLLDRVRYYHFFRAVQEK